MADPNKDTIAAVSTPPGEGGIGVVRISGEDSVKIAGDIFFSRSGKELASYRSHSVSYGEIKSPSDGKTIDEVLVTVMRSPRTYTTEDVVEISCHGGSMPLKKILQLCLEKGARVAEPGEFTKRAFLNGRIDLAQAEAVLDIIRSGTERSCSVAAEQLEGRFSGQIRNLRGSIFDILADIELAIDFTEEDVKFAAAGKIARDLGGLYHSIEEILSSADKGMILREGLKVVICGRPNVGKSSLMNALLRHERVIVTPVAGTTRDTVEETINISGITVRLSDTAGIIETRDRVEVEAIKRSRKKLEQADIVIFMIDSSSPLSGKDQEIYNTVRGKDVIIALNKTDLPREIDLDDVTASFDGKKPIEVSALKRSGLEKIEDAIAGAALKGEKGFGEGVIVTNLRHKRALEMCLEAVRRGRDMAGQEFNGELLASDLNEAAHYLGLIIGESIEADVLDRIFSEFCIGK